ncbi:MAG: ATP-binding cassette domain-containing protein, partial [Treponema sp.]|nr:ATP-binding cassette domain-containing protein [Treponema sp.]
GEGGVKLSGGERQRICIARAILKNAPIIIFDEATSYTDIENEYKIQRALENLLKGKTVIMIAHRLHTIVGADQICVFDRGELAGTGTHGELLERGGLYRRMWEAYGRTPETQEAAL